MKGRKTSDEKKEHAKALLYINPSITERELARETNIPKTTIHELKKELISSDEFDQVRAIKKQEFINEAWEIVKRTLGKMNEKLDIMTKEALEKVNIRDLAVTLGTIYDKQALASGEPTQISESRKSIPDLVKDTETKLEELKKLVNE
jgi:hypothetical protein